MRRFEGGKDRFWENGIDDTTVPPRDPGRCLLGLIALLAACGDAYADDTKALPAETHSYVVDTVGKSTLTMHVVGCPAVAVEAWWSRTGGDPHSAPTDTACLGKITVGKTIVHSVQMFENPKLEPKRMIVRKLDGCSATDVVITPAFAPCPAEPPRGTTFERFGSLGVGMTQAAVETALGEGQDTSGERLDSGRLVWGLNYLSRGIQVGFVGKQRESGIVTTFELAPPNRFTNSAGISIGMTRTALIKALGSRYRPNSHDDFEIDVKVPAPTYQIAFELISDKVSGIRVGLEPKK